MSSFVLFNTENDFKSLNKKISAYLQLCVQTVMFSQNKSNLTFKICFSKHDGGNLDLQPAPKILAPLVKMELNGYVDF